MSCGKEHCIGCAIQPVINAHVDWMNSLSEEEASAEYDLFTQTILGMLSAVLRSDVKAVITPHIEGEAGEAIH